MYSVVECQPGKAACWLMMARLQDYDPQLLHLQRFSGSPNVHDSQPGIPAEQDLQSLAQGRDLEAAPDALAEMPERLGILQRLRQIFSEPEVVIFFVMTILYGFAAGRHS